MGKAKKYVLCGYCNKPIHVSEFGGIEPGPVFFHNKCKSHNLLKRALDSIKKMSSEEVQRISKEKGIVVPEEPKLYKSIDGFAWKDATYEEIKE